MKNGEPEPLFKLQALGDISSSRVGQPLTLKESNQ